MTQKQRFYNKLEYLKRIEDLYISEMMGYNKQFITNVRRREFKESTYKRYCDMLDIAIDKISADILKSKDV